jgi:hypothetical protein
MVAYSGLENGDFGDGRYPVYLAAFPAASTSSFVRRRSSFYDDTHGRRSHGRRRTSPGSIGRAMLKELVKSVTGG